MKHFKSISGFTLIELSIVLAIIGLIISGIISGRNLVKAAQLRSVVSDVRSYDTAISNFKDTYSQLPGDFDDAYSFWGTNCSTGASSCNGNNNGQIYPTSGRNEWLMAIKHLSLAGLITGSYTGTSVLVNSETTPGENTIAGRLANSEIIFGGGHDGSWVRANINSDLWIRNSILYGRHDTPDASFCEGALFAPVDAAALDTKIDDGMPIMGRVRSVQGVTFAPTTWTTDCFTASVVAGTAATYTLNTATAVSPQCWMWFDLSASAAQW